MSTRHHHEREIKYRGCIELLSKPSIASDVAANRRLPRSEKGSFKYVALDHHSDHFGDRVARRLQWNRRRPFLRYWLLRGRRSRPRDCCSFDFAFAGQALINRKSLEGIALVEL